MQWVVVHFILENSVEAVPITWLNGSKCYWPPYGGTRMKTAILKGEPPCIEWPNFAMRQIGEPYDDLTTARTKAIRAESTSDVNSDIEVKRKITRNKKYNNDVTESEDSTDSYSDTPPQVALPYVPCILEENPTTALGNEAVNLTNNTLSPKNAKDSYDESFKRQVFRQLFLLHAKMDEIQKDVNVLVNKMLQTPAELVQEQLLEKFALPLKTVQDLKVMEEFLTNKDNACKLAKELSLIGGTSHKIMVRRLMTRLFSNCLAMQYSWIGFKQKANFSVLFIAGVLVDAVKLVYKNKTEADIEVEIKMFLVKAKSRLEKEKNAVDVL